MNSEDDCEPPEKSLPTNGSVILGICLTKRVK
jgi:hypothetical protein